MKSFLKKKLLAILANPQKSCREAESLPENVTTPNISTKEFYYEYDSSARKYIFMHIHKCAGTSMWQTLQGYPGFLCCIARPGKFPHGLSREYIEDKVWTNSFKFTFVRNPYARLVSNYKMFKRSDPWNKIFRNFSDFVDLIRWSDIDCHVVNQEVDTDSYVRKVDNIIHHASSFHNPKYRLSEMDYIGKIETLEEDMAKILSELKHPGIKILKANASSQYNYRDYYTHDLKDIVTQKYKTDIERFGYEF